MTDKESLIEFPCAFPIKAMGLAADDFDTLVVSLVRLHATDLSEGAVKTKASANGKYLSVTVTVSAAIHDLEDRAPGNGIGFHQHDVRPVTQRVLSP